MKQKLKNKRLAFRSILVAGLLVAATGSYAQRAAVTADPELGKIVLTDQTGFPVDASQIQPDQVINLKIPVLNDGHGQALPAGSCKIKIGFGSKLVLDPQYNINNTALSNYFKWSSVTIGGQLQVTGDLVAPLPANITEVNVSFKVKASLEGKSTITANFLITNHNTTAVLSDEDGANNVSSLQYRIVGKVAPSTPAGKLKLSLYPNPVKDEKSVVIKVEQGQLKGKYSISLTDISGKLIQSKEVELNAVPGVTYSFGNIAAGQYLIKVRSNDDAQTTVLKFEKL